MMEFTWSDGIPPLFSECTFATFRKVRGAKEAHGLCGGYASNFGRRSDSGVYIHGPAGSGKTHLAVAIMRDITARIKFDPGHPRFIDVHTLVQVTRRPPTDLAGPDPLEVIMAAPFLVLDGVDAETGAEHVKSILRYRYNHCLPTVVTSTMAPGEELERVLGAGVVSRLYQMCDEAYLTAPDKRKASRDFLFV